LGLPLFISYSKPRHFSSLIDKIRTKIDGWMVKSLSAAGTAELIRSVLHNILAYWVGSFKLPGSVVKELERLFVNFFWNNRMHAWSWKDIYRPKAEGGLGMR